MRTDPSRGTRAACPWCLEVCVTKTLGVIFSHRGDWLPVDFRKAVIDFVTHVEETYQATQQEDTGVRALSEWCLLRFEDNLMKRCCTVRDLDKELRLVTEISKINSYIYTQEEDKLEMAVAAIDKMIPDPDMTQILQKGSCLFANEWYHQARVANHLSACAKTCMTLQYYDVASMLYRKLLGIQCSFLLNNSPRLIDSLLTLAKSYEMSARLAEGKDVKNIFTPKSFGKQLRVEEYRKKARQMCGYLRENLILDRMANYKNMLTLYLVGQMKILSKTDDFVSEEFNRTKIDSPEVADLFGLTHIGLSLAWLGLKSYQIKSGMNGNATADSELELLIDQFREKNDVVAVDLLSELK